MKNEYEDEMEDDTEMLLRRLHAPQPLRLQAKAEGQRLKMAKSSPSADKLPRHRDADDSMKLWAECRKRNGVPERRRASTRRNGLDPSMSKAPPASAVRRPTLTTLKLDRMSPAEQQRRLTRKMRAEKTDRPRLGKVVPRRTYQSHPGWRRKTERTTAAGQGGRPRANRAEDWNRRPPAEVARPLSTAEQVEN